MENKEIKVTQSSIDKDVLDVMKDTDILNSLSDEKQMKRFELNLFCEFLSEIKGLKKEIDELNQLISITSSDKIAEFFTKLQQNVEDEKVRLNMQKRIRQGHKKSTKK